MSVHPGRCVPIETILLATCRFIAGGAFLLAAMMKLSDPPVFMLAIAAFGMLPEALIPFAAYAVPWIEVVAGVLLVYGFWSRPAGLVATGLYAVFTAALAWVFLSGASVDCGCFGGLFGRGDVGVTSLLRNAVFLTASIAVTWRGGGAASLDAVLAARRPAD
ncbi:MAG: DoxX family membrane protein [Candidatus Sumerlaeia bacterium]|nr:DoxX family membrane protein [Candidatus Sumerlaeia bacterium]